MMIPHFDFCSESQFEYLQKNGFHTQKQEPTEKAVSQLHETLNDFVSGSNTSVVVRENEDLESETDGRYNIPENC